MPVSDGHGSPDLPANRSKNALPTLQNRISGRFCHCSLCDVSLVESLDSLESFSEPDGSHLAWRGNDLVAFSRVLAALRDNKIQSYQIAQHDQLTRFGSIRPSYEIFLRRHDGPPRRRLFAMRSRAGYPSSRRLDSPCDRIEYCELRMVRFL